MQGILIFSGCISTEKLWMATNCPYYANETAHLEIAYVALLKMQESLVCKVQFNKPSLLKTFKPQDTESLLLISHYTRLRGGNHEIHLQITIPLKIRKLAYINTWEMHTQQAVRTLLTIIKRNIDDPVQEPFRASYLSGGLKHTKKSIYTIRFLFYRGSHSNWHDGREPLPRKKK